ncbi:MAG: hypothetical protein KC431_21795, partial [Myxococcales bacterium]|nr:hypothetical protein [Myxococcales bacterium]
MNRTRIVPLTACLSLLVACSDDGSGNIYGNDDSAQTSITLGTLDGQDSIDSSDSNDTSTTDGSTDTTTDSSTGGTKLDVLGEETSMGTAGDAQPGDGCQKVDFLFVIDNSGSMLEEQDNLASSFPAFINSISSTLSQAQDYHIMVIDTDHWVFAGCNILSCLFPPLPGICVGYECGDVPEQCEDILGAGVTWPKGANASNINCNFSSGKRFITDNQPNLPGTFQCAARVGTDSTDDPERPMEAMVAAVSGQGAVGTCNDGFLRDDAILVVTFITDEDDDAGDGSAGTVDSWRQAL